MCIETERRVRREIRLRKQLRRDERQRRNEEIRRTREFAERLDDHNRQIFWRQQDLRNIDFHRPDQEEMADEAERPVVEDEWEAATDDPFDTESDCQIRKKTP